MSGSHPKGTSSEHRRTIKSLALAWRESTDFEAIRKRLMSFIEGRDPSTGGPVEPAVSLKAIEIFLNRTHGQAAQFVVLEQQIRSESTPQFATKYEGMNLEEIQAKRARLLAAGAQRKIIEAEAVETPSSGGNDDEV